MRCAKTTISHAGGAVRHVAMGGWPAQRLYALDGGEVVRVGHPDRVLALAEGDQQRNITVLVVDVDPDNPGAEEPTPEHFTKGGQVPGQVLSRTNHRQARCSTRFEVPDRFVKRLGAQVAAMMRAPSSGAALDELEDFTAQLEAETARWVDVARRVGALNTAAVARELASSKGPAPRGPAHMRQAVVARLQSHGLDKGDTRRRVVAPSRTLSGDHPVTAGLAKLAPRAGAPVGRRVEVVGVDDHALGRYAQRFLGLDDRASVEELVGGAGHEALDEDQALATAETVLSELVSNPLHDARFANDMLEVSRPEAERLTGHGQAQVLDRFTVLVPVTRDDSAQTRYAQLVLRTCGTGSNPAGPVRASVVSCMFVDPRDHLGWDQPRATPLPSELQRGRWVGPEQSPPLSRRAEATFRAAAERQQALRARRRMAAA